MSYTTYDFSESISGAGIAREDIESVEAAWGETGDYAEWSGGFVFRMRDGRRFYLTGWCDTTGWGCQDGTELAEIARDDVLPDPDNKVDWDMHPADLNRFVHTGEGKWD